MRRPWAICTAVTLGCLMLLGSAGRSRAASRPVFPDIRVHERLGDIDHQAADDIDTLYLYGTLSLLERQAGPYRIDVSSIEHRHLLPLAVFDIYHDIPTYIQSEFSEYTVWGVLADAMYRDATLVMAGVEQVDALQTRFQPGSAEGRRQPVPGLGLNALFDLRSDHVFNVDDVARLQGEQRRVYAAADFHIGRGGVDYHGRGIIAQTLKRMLALARTMMDHKVLTLGLFGVALLVFKVTQGIMSRAS